jgi:hypothetical protein
MPDEMKDRFPAPAPAQPEPEVSAKMTATATDALALPQVNTTVEAAPPVRPPFKPKRGLRPTEPPPTFVTPKRSEPKERVEETAPEVHPQLSPRTLREMEAGRAALVNRRK